MQILGNEANRMVGQCIRTYKLPVKELKVN